MQTMITQHTTFFLPLGSAPFAVIHHIHDVIFRELGGNTRQCQACLFNRSLMSTTVKPDLSGHSKIDKTKISMTNGSLMKVESILQYF